MYLYDKLCAGHSYLDTRRPDPRVAKRIKCAIGDSASVANLGAGTGSYEPRDRFVIAVEPSVRMLAQRPDGSAPAIQGRAEALPLANGAVDAALAILTIHHWDDPAKGMAEMRRVARRRIVIFTWDQDVWESFWLIRDYFPGIRGIDRRRAIAISDIIAVFGNCRIHSVPIPHDCTDAFHGAFWRRPEAYLDSRIRAGISTYASMDDNERLAGLRRLSQDVRSGSWQQRYRSLLDLNELDIGYRLIVAECHSA